MWPAISQGANWDRLMAQKQGGKTSKPSVFLSYSAQDKPTAQLLALRFQDAGIEVFSDTPPISPGGDWTQSVQERMRASDYMIVLLSTLGLQSQHLQKEVLSAKTLQELSDRSITVIPVLLDDVGLPGPLRDIQYVDFRSDPRAAVDALVSRFRSTFSTDLSHLSGEQFENLIGDLLVDLGLEVERDVRVGFTRFDYRANFRSSDPFGAPSNEVWLIEAKHYSATRLSVQVISEFVSNIQPIRHDATHFALITSGQITSAAREMTRAAAIRVVEGVELKRLLLTRPHLVSQHFGAQSS